MLNSINWPLILAGTKDELEAQKVRANSSWILPQLMGFFASLPLAKSAGKFSFTKTIRSWSEKIATDTLVDNTGLLVQREVLSGKLKALNTSPRGNILNGKQTLPQSLRYNTAVPLFLSAYKEFRGVQYSDWDYDDPSAVFFVDKYNLELIKFATSEAPPRWTEAKLRDYRDLGRKVQTGPKAGTSTPILAATALHGIPDPEFTALPKLVKLALAQVWVYAPEVRHALAISNAYDLDSPPQDLVSTKLLTQTAPTAHSMWELAL